MVRLWARVPILALLAVPLVGLALLAEEARTQEPIRIGYVDIQRVLVRSAAGVAAREQVEREKVSMQRDVDAKRAEVEKLRDEIQKKGPLLTTEARKEKQEALERGIRDLRRLADDYRAELEKKEQELGRRILVDISGVVERIGKQKRYLLIVERRNAGVIYGSPQADLTDEIIKAFDRDVSRRGKK